MPTGTRLQTIAAVMDDRGGLLSNSDEVKYSQRVETSRRKYGVRLMLELCLLVGFVASVSCAIGLGLQVKFLRKINGYNISPECIHAVGGGPVASGGGLDAAAPKQYRYCMEQLAAYAHPQHGAYWREVDLAAADAMQVFGFNYSSLQYASPHATSMGDHVEQSSVDIKQVPAKQQAMLRPVARHMLEAHRAVKTVITHDTAQDIYSRSSVHRKSQQQQVEHLGQMAGPGPAAAAAAADVSGLQRRLLEPLAPDKQHVVIFDIDETVLSNMQQILNPEEWPWDRWVQAAQAPALQPVQQFYRALCKAGFSVAFVTGRKEAARERTKHNLEKAGYGTVCAKQVGLDSSSRDVHSTAGSSTSSTECCYVALYMRPQNDTRLASVYKPWARQQLLSSNGLQLAALVGDQFSDLNGDVSAPYAFKLPNPFYYIL